MTSHSTIADEPQSERQTAVHLFDHWFDPIDTVSGAGSNVRPIFYSWTGSTFDKSLILLVAG